MFVPCLFLFKGFFSLREFSFHGITIFSLSSSLIFFIFKKENSFCLQISFLVFKIFKILNFKLNNPRVTLCVPHME